MSKQSLESAIGKAILDNEFRNTLFAFPDEALADFDLSAAEKNMLKRVDCETLELLEKTLNARLDRHRAADKSRFGYGNGQKYRSS